MSGPTQRAGDAVSTAESPRTIESASQETWFQFATRSLPGLVPVDLVSIAVGTGDGALLTPIIGEDILGLDDAVRSPDSAAAQAAASQQTHVATATANSPDVALLRLAGLLSVAVVPLVGQAQSLGVLIAARREEHWFTSEDIALLETAASVLTVSLQKHQIEGRSQAIVETSMDALITTDHAGNVIDWNPRAIELLGWSAQAAAGQSVVDLIIPSEMRRDVREGLKMAGSQAVTPVIGRFFEMTALRRDGSAFPSEVSITTWVVAGQRFYCWVLRDITERRHSEAELIRARDAAQAADHAKSEFLATMSHEIRTPMNGVLGMTELLLQSGLTPKQYELAYTAHHSANALLDIINDVLDFSRIEAGRIELRPTLFELEETVSSVGALLADRGDKKHVTVRTETIGPLPEVVGGDPSRLRQILINLVGNAIRFTEKGSVILRVSCHMSSQDTVNTLFEVIDTGPGISADQLSNIFDPFVQAPTDDHKVRSGSGLGLAISRRLTELMGGSIGVDSTLGKGSRFWVEIPFERAEAFRATSVLTDRNAPAEPRQATRSLSILVVEDDAVNQVVASRMLESIGCQVSLAGNGAEAVERVESEVFDIVFMDCMMPVMDGYASTGAIREWEATRQPPTHVPIVALTANSMPGDKARCLAAGMDDYLAKPFNRNSLIEILDRWGSGAPPTDANDDPMNEPLIPIVENPQLKELSIDVVSEVVETFCEFSAGVVDDLANAATCRDFAQLQQRAHSLKSAAANVGAMKLSSMATDLEKAAASQLDDAADSTGLDLELERSALALVNEHRRVLAALRAWLDTVPQTAIRR